MKYKLTNEKTLEIVHDNEPIETPRSFSTLTTMVFFGKHKSYGDNHNITLESSFNGRADFIIRGGDEIKKKTKAVICKPVHLYSHSGKTISTSYTYPYNCPWDSGTMGFAIVTEKAIKKFFTVKEVTQELIEAADKILETEVGILDKYISGEVYGFRVFDKEGKEVDSCWGFFGSNVFTNGMLEHINEDILEEL